MRAGANPNSVLNDDTPLIALPVICGHEEMLELLLANGANLDALVGEGLRLLDVALGREMVEMANLARRQGREEVLWQMRETVRMQST